MYRGEVKVKHRSVMKRRNNRRIFPPLSTPFFTFLFFFFSRLFEKSFFQQQHSLLIILAVSVLIAWFERAELDSPFFPSFILLPILHFQLSLQKLVCFIFFPHLSLCLPLFPCSSLELFVQSLQFYSCPFLLVSGNEVQVKSSLMSRRCSFLLLFTRLSLSLFLSLYQPLPLNLCFFFFSDQRRYNKFLGGDSSFSKMSCQRKIIDERDQKQVVKKIDVIHLQ